MGNIPNRFDSIMDATIAPGAIPGQHFIEWFSGKVVPTYWDSTIETGGSLLMGDGIDEGVIIRGTSAFWFTTMNMKSNNMVDPRNCVFDCVQHKPLEANYITEVGISDNRILVNLEKHLAVQTTQIGTMRFQRRDTSQANSTISGVDDTAPLRVRIEGNSANALCSINGILKVTATTQRPSTKLGPTLQLNTVTSATHDLHIRYVEVYNKV